jgi:folate-binding protein YgfZ
VHVGRGRRLDAQEPGLHVHGLIKRNVVAVHQYRRAGVVVQFFQAPDVIDMRVGTYDGLHLQLVPAEQVHDPVDFITGVDDNSLACDRVPQDGAVALQQPDRHGKVQQPLHVWRLRSAGHIRDYSIRASAVRRCGAVGPRPTVVLLTLFVKLHVMSEAVRKPVLETPLLALHKSQGVTMGTWFGCALPDRFGDWLDEYRAARENLALIDKNYRAHLRFTGPDRVRYLNAILTNNIKDLPVGSGIVSLMLTPQGRIQAEIETYALPESLCCLSFAMIRETLVPALDKYIIMDDVTLVDETENWGTLGLEGPLAAAVTKKLTGLDLAGIGDLSFREVQVEGIFCVLGKRSPGGLAAAEFRVHRGDLETLWMLLQQAVAASAGLPVGFEALSALRLEQGVPWFGYDFGEKQIPHEAGVQDSHISSSKGCYTGQEIVERVRSRGQVNRVRVLLKMEGHEPPASGTPLLANGQESGHVTRSAFSPALRSAIAMGYLRRENSAPASELTWAGGKATVISPPVDASS